MDRLDNVNARIRVWFACGTASLMLACGQVQIVTQTPQGGKLSLSGDRDEAFADAVEEMEKHCGKDRYAIEDSLGNPEASPTPDAKPSPPLTEPTQSKEPPQSQPPQSQPPQSKPQSEGFPAANTARDFIRVRARAPGSRFRGPLRFSRHRSSTPAAPPIIIEYRCLKDVAPAPMPPASTEDIDI
jgi:hypothetical protein